MMKESVSFWGSFEEQTGVELDFQQAGYLLGVTDAGSLSGVRKMLQRHRAAGLKNKLLTPTEVTDRYPELAVDQFAAIIHAPEDGYLDPHRALMGFKKAAQEAGVTIRTNCRVKDLQERADGRIVGVETSEETIEADCVVNAAGAWASNVAELADVQLPIQPRARRAATVAPSSTPDKQLPLFVDLGSGVYFRPLDDDQFIIGGQFSDEDSPVDPQPNPNKRVPSDWQLSALEHAAVVGSHFDTDTEVVNTWEGRYAMTPDENPIIEESRPGLYTVAGFSGHGVMIAPAAGQLLADLILKGDSRLVDVSKYSSSRDFRTDEVVPQF
jgi:sarcosine oxidase subunit beta